MQNQIKLPTPSFLAQLGERNVPLHMDFLTSAPHPKVLPPAQQLEIALVGRSNVGKSSLLNFLAGQKQLARVSTTPGRTQLINLFQVDHTQFQLADLPGYGYAETPKSLREVWEKAMYDYFTERETLVGVLFLVDARRKSEGVDRDLVQWFLEIGLNVMVVQTKCDKLNKSEQTQSRKEKALGLGVAVEGVINSSVTKKEGLNALMNALAGMLHSGTKMVTDIQES